MAKSKSEPQPSGGAPLKKGRCSRCGKAFQFESISKHKPFPFCSDRCKDVDMGNWLMGRYAIPGKPIPAEQLDEESHDAT